MKRLLDPSLLTNHLVGGVNLPAGVTAEPHNGIAPSSPFSCSTFHGHPRPHLHLLFVFHPLSLSLSLLLSLFFFICIYCLCLSLPISISPPPLPPRPGGRVTHRLTPEPATCLILRGERKDTILPGLLPTATAVKHVLNEALMKCE